MSGRFGKNEWKVKLASIIGIVVLIGVILVVVINGFSAIKPKYEEYQSAQQQREAEEQDAWEEQENPYLDDAEIAANTGVADNYEEVTGAYDEMTDQSVTEPESAPETVSESVLDREYIFPDSNSRYLSSSDVEGMTLQEINYAKNEIYARKGRQFKAVELQEYFGSKSWYNGTIAPDNFSDNMLNDYERTNARFLSDVEHSINSNGYQPS